MNTTTYGLKKNDPSPQCAAIMLKLLKKTSRYRNLLWFKMCGMDCGNTFMWKKIIYKTISISALKKLFFVHLGIKPPQTSAILGIQSSNIMSWPKN